LRKTTKEIQFKIFAKHFGAITNHAERLDPSSEAELSSAGFATPLKCLHQTLNFDWELIFTLYTNM
jgi:hypothetical protein